MEGCEFAQGYASARLFMDPCVKSSSCAFKSIKFASLNLAKLEFLNSEDSKYSVMLNSAYSAISATLNSANYASSASSA